MNLDPELLMNPTFTGFLIICVTSLAIFIRFLVKKVFFVHEKAITVMEKTAASIDKLDATNDRMCDLIHTHILNGVK